MVVVAVKVPSGRTVAPSAGTPAKSWLELNALERSLTPVAHSEPAWSGPTDPDTVTVCPARIGFGLAWTATGGVGDAAQAGTASSAGVPIAAANSRAAMTRDGRMAVPFCGLKASDTPGPGDVGRARTDW